MPSDTEELWPDGLDHDAGWYPPAVKAGNWVFLSEQRARGADGETVEQARVHGDFPFYESGHTKQTDYVLDSIETILNEAGGDINDVLRIYQWWVTPEEDHDWLNAKGWTKLSITRYLERLYGEYIHEKSPGSTGMGVRDLRGDDTIVTVDGIWRVAADEEKNAVTDVPDMPQPAGDYAEAVEKGGFIFTCGEHASDYQRDWGRNWNRPDRYPDAKTAKPSAAAWEVRTNPYMWYGEPIREYTDHNLSRLEKIVGEFDTPIENTVFAEVYLPDPADFPGFEEVWQEWFPDDPPARIVMPHQGLGIEASRVEIALHLVKDGADIDVEYVTTDDAPEPVTHQSQAVRAGDLLFISGQMAFDENGASPVGARGQMNEVLDNVAAICEAGGTSLDNVVRTQCFYADFSAYGGAMEAWRSRFEPGSRPTNAAIEVGDPLMVPGCEVLVNTMAYVP
jgi:enamine deaminase RidA (YjgF/YER057c/UK114 family)